MSTEATKRKRGGRALRIALDAVLSVAVLYMVFLVGSSAVDAANRRAELRLLRNEAESLYRAFSAFHDRNRAYPAAFGESSFDPKTLDPLRKRGYYRGPLSALVRGRAADAYGAPAGSPTEREFWLELTLRSDPAVRVLVARSDDAPLSGGLWSDGVFVYRDGRLEVD